MQGIRVVINEGKQHPVDSNDVAFKIAAHEAFKQAYPLAGPVVLEPIMKFSVRFPGENQDPVQKDLSKRRALIGDTQ